MTLISRLRGAAIATFLDGDRVRHTVAAARRRVTGAPPTVHYYHDLADPWSYLTAQLAARIADTYPVTLRFHLVGPPAADVDPAPTLRLKYEVKDAAVLANCRDRDARRLWVQRILDHDGASGDEGGIEAWLRLGEAVGLSREEMLDERHVLPGVRFAVDAYVNFARAATWQEAACSSLTEMFAPEIHQRRLDNWPAAYPWATNISASA